MAGIGDARHIAHFRGRRLFAHPLPLPGTHRGVVAMSTDEVLPRAPTEAASAISTMAQGTSDEMGDMYEEDQAQDQEVEIKIMKEVASFDQMLIWGHENAPGGPGAEEDAYWKGVNEWIGWAAAVSCSSFG